MCTAQSASILVTQEVTLRFFLSHRETHCTNGHFIDMMVGNITFKKIIFAVIDAWLLTQWINCSLYHNI